ncbi:MAG: hypothetical protein GY870_21475 [archaeon]|nr:hypothetical protein [archaeon]
MIFSVIFSPFDLFVIFAKIPVIVLMLRGLVISYKKYRIRNIQITLMLGLIFASHLIACINGIIYLFLINIFGYNSYFTLIPIINGCCLGYAASFMMEITQIIFYSNRNQKGILEKGGIITFIFVTFIGILTLIFLFINNYEFIELSGAILIIFCFLIYFITIFNVTRVLNWSKKNEDIDKIEYGKMQSFYLGTLILFISTMFIAMDFIVGDNYHYSWLYPTGDLIMAVGMMFYNKMIKKDQKG